MATEKWYVAQIYCGEQMDITDYGDPVMRDVYGYRILTEEQVKEYEDDIKWNKGPFYDKAEAEQLRYDLSSSEW